MQIYKDREGNLLIARYSGNSVVVYSQLTLQTNGVVALEVEEKVANVDVFRKEVQPTCLEYLPNEQKT